MGEYGMEVADSPEFLKDCKRRAVKFVAAKYDVDEAYVVKVRKRNGITKADYYHELLSCYTESGLDATMRAFNLSEERLRQRLRNMGVSITTRGQEIERERIAYIEEGHTVAEVSEHLGMERTNVYRFCKEHGLKLKPLGHPKKHEGLREEIVAGWRSGEYPSRSALAEAKGVSRQYVSFVLKDC